MTANIKRVALITLAAAALSSGGIAAASIPAPDGTITACSKSYSAYLLDSGTCKSGWTRATWNVQGPKGEQGEQGPKGDKGEPGPAGVPGSSEPSTAYAARSTGGDQQVVGVDYGNAVDIDATHGATVVSKSVVAGSYAVTAQATAQDLHDSGVTVYCWLSAGNVVLDKSASDLKAEFDQTSISLVGSVPDFEGGTLSVGCIQGGPSGKTLAVASIHAIKVDSIQ